MIEHMKKTRAGFTLVELIVVIAILGILAGISIPVYSGYISKAAEAADMQLLGAMNTAFAASCAEMGQPPQSVNAYASLSGDDGAKKLSAVTVPGLSDFNDTFFRYFAGNEDSTFKKIAVLQYVPAEGVFVGYTANETIMYSFGDTQLAISATDLAAYLGSTYDEMGASVLTGAVDTLVDSALKNASALFSEDNSPGFNAFFNALELEEPNYDEIEDEEEKAAAKEAWEKTKGTALVLYVASKVDDYNTDTIYSTLLETGTLSNAQNSVFEASSMYALMTGYVNSDYAEKITSQVTETVNMMNGVVYDGVEYHNIKQYYEAKYGTFNKNDISTEDKVNYTITTTTTYDPAAYYEQQTEKMYSPVNVIQMYQEYYNNDSNFQKYMQEQGKSDLEAFAGALSMINDNTANIDLQNVLSNGLTQGGIADMLSQITGN